MCTTYNEAGWGINAVAGARILLLMTYRPGNEMPGLAHSHVSQLAVSRLSPRAGLALVRNIASEDQVPVALAEAIVGKATRNPFFLEELTWSAVTERGHSASASVPGTVVERMVQRLGDPDRIGLVRGRLRESAKLGQAHGQPAAIVDRGRYGVPEIVVIRVGGQRILTTTYLEQAHYLRGEHERVVELATSSGRRTHRRGHW